LYYNKINSETIALKSDKLPLSKTIPFEQLLQAVSEKTKQYEEIHRTLKLFFIIPKNCWFVWRDVNYVTQIV